MSDFVWPSDSDRAESDELNRVCEYLEEVLGAQSSNSVPSEHGKNRYGLDMAYFRELFNRELNRPLVDFRPDELARVLARAARTADAAVLQEPEFQAARAQSGKEVARLVGKVRMLIATGNRLNAEAQECTYDDGAAEVASVDFWDEFRGALEAATEALAAYRKQWSVPDGWKLVPVEPTKAMRDAAQDAFERVAMITYQGIYRAMLAAAPQPPKEGE